ncbi:MAG TPA: crosslink repair DNA glycosylase YcaQ family protein [Jatrophihabitans sp.]|nr:crosslink repair DNA glycosylase YcaQ family protein [Jatrophihabitans sp.]
MTKTPTVTREQVIAYRVATQGLHREAQTVGDLDVLDIGIQEAMGHPAAVAYAARLTEAAAVTPDTVAVGPGHRLALTWSLRGAPHVHRRADLDALAAALFPLSEADAAGRLNETGPSVKRQGIAALDQFEIAVQAMRAVVTSATAKGAASTEVTKRIPKPMRHECRACKTSHISDSAMRVATLPAGLEIEPGTAPPVLLRRKGAKLPKAADAKALAALARAYLRFLGPATVTEFAGYLEARRVDVAEHWPDDLVEVSVDGKTAYLAPGELAALRTAPAPELVRLLGPFDPFMQARDRATIVPDKSVHKALWPVLGRPGVLFVDGEVAGMWRTKTAGKKLSVTVEAFAALRPAVWTQVDAEAERVAVARGAADVAVKRLA